MIEYKRVTQKDADGNWCVEYANGDITLAPNLATQEVFNYLAELENKIELGCYGSISVYPKVARLKQF